MMSEGTLPPPWTGRVSPSIWLKACFTSTCAAWMRSSSAARTAGSELRPSISLFKPAKSAEKYRSNRSPGGAAGARRPSGLTLTKHCSSFGLARAP